MTNRTFRIILATLVAILAVSAAQHLAHSQTDKDNSGSSHPDARIVIQNYYYAEPGKSEDLYKGLLESSDVREKLGFRRGRLLRRFAMVGDPFSTPGEDRIGAEDLPDVVWECEYPDAATREREFKALIATPQYEAVHERFVAFMRKLERSTYKAPETAPRSHD